MNRLLSFSFLFLSLHIIGQTSDRLTIMTYNLLNYRNTTQQCTASTNDASDKEQDLHTIVTYVDPDILVCNEIGGNSAQPVDQLLANALNINGVTKYSKANYSNNSFSSLVNMIYFNSNVLGLISQNKVEKDLNNQSLVRVIDLYRFYYKDPLLNAQSDTVYFTVVAAHLKAGNTGSDANARAAATASLMNYIQNFVKDDNVILCGDLNTYKSQEQSYQNLINHSNSNYNFYDPINTPGVWNNNSTFAAIHTQSTRTSSTNGGCFSGGGLDDRFDHIMASDAVINNLDRIEYVNNSYKAMGNDGLHFNKHIKDGTNNSVPSSILNALYDLSDHLPVIMEIDIQQMQIGISDYQIQDHQLLFNNPAQNELFVELRNKNIDNANCILSDLSGKTILTQAFHKDNRYLTSHIYLAGIKPGIYVLTVLSDENWHLSKKLIVY